MENVKYSGIKREVDLLGRITIPVEIRKELSIKQGDELSFLVIYDSKEKKKKILLTKEKE